VHFLHSKLLYPIRLDIKFDITPISGFS